jgi:hypothetical protein
MDTRFTATKKTLFRAFEDGDAKGFEEALAGVNCAKLGPPFLVVLLRLMSLSIEKGEEVRVSLLPKHRQMLSCYIKRHPASAEGARVYRYDEEFVLARPPAEPPKEPARSFANVFTAALWPGDLATVRLIQAAGAKPCTTAGLLIVEGEIVFHIPSVLLMIGRGFEDEESRLLVAELLVEWQSTLSEHAKQLIGAALGATCLSWIRTGSDATSAEWKSLQRFLDAGFVLLLTSDNTDIFADSSFLDDLAKPVHRPRAVVFLEAALKAKCVWTLY